MKKNNSNTRRKFVMDVYSTAVGSLFLSSFMDSGKSGATGYNTLFNDLEHVVVAGKEGRFFAWPANNGMWTWDDGNEILLGYTDGPWVEQKGHNIGHPLLTKLARSIDGGASWTSENRDNFFGNVDDPVSSPRNFTFDHKGFALRVAVTGYHGTDDSAGRFFVSFTRSKTWQGPFTFNGINDDPNLEGMQIPARTGYLVTGSTEVGTGICKRSGDRNERLQMEMGGKNALVILNDADLEASAQAAVTAAFICSGQWCTATSRITVEEGIYDTFCREFVKSVAELKRRTGMDPDVSFGPVASSRQKEVAINAIKRAKKEGVQLLCGGNAPELVKGKPGYFEEPTVFGVVTASMHLFRDEIIGPVVGVTRAKNARHALQLVNDSQYGLSFSVFTTDLEKADIFLKEVHCGMVHHILHTAYRHPSMPITGWEESDRGIWECGRYARDFYTRIKAVYRCN